MRPMQAESKREAPGRDPRCCSGDGMVGGDCLGGRQAYGGSP